VKAQNPKPGSSLLQVLLGTDSDRRFAPKVLCRGGRSGSGGSPGASPKIGVVQGAGILLPRNQGSSGHLPTPAL
jgi:hypothetical protein